MDFAGGDSPSIRGEAGGKGGFTPGPDPGRFRVRMAAPAMKKLAFRRHAERFWDEIPPKYRAGAVLLVHWDAEPDPENPGVFLLGACERAYAALDEVFDLGGGQSPLDRQSLVHLWYGSFAAMALESEAFDWTGEIEETLLHELTHHWEQRAGLDGLDRFDAAQIENFRRVRGLAVVPGFWRDGMRVGPDRWEIDGDIFVELPGPPPWTFDPGDGGGTVTATPDADLGFALLPERGGYLDAQRRDLVLAPRPAAPLPWWRRLFALFRKPAARLPGDST